MSGQDAMVVKEEEEQEEEEVNEDEFELLFKRFAQEAILVQVLEVKVEGNIQTHASVIQAQLDPLKNAETTKELLREAAHAVNRIESLGIFDKCIISLEDGPVQGSVIVVVHVQEGMTPCSIDLATFSQTKDQKVALECCITCKNLLGFGETWDGDGSYAWDGDHQMSVGFHLPQYKHVPSALATRIALSTGDWLKLSSYKVRLAGFSIGLISDDNHDLSYNLTWQPWQDNNNLNGPHLLPSVKYAYKLDERNSILRPTRGYAFRFATQLSRACGDLPTASARQDVDFRCAIPLGFYNSAINIGLSGGFTLPWTRDYFTKSTFTSDRFFVRKQSSLVCDMNGPATILGFITRRMAFSEAAFSEAKEGEVDKRTSDSRNHLRGGLAASAFADFSFDLPAGVLRGKDVYGHCFFCAGKVIDVTEVERGHLPFQGFISSLKCFVGAGIVIPTRWFRLEVNFCQMLGQQHENASRRGIQIGFSSSS